MHSREIFLERQPQKPALKVVKNSMKYQFLPILQQKVCKSTITHRKPGKVAHVSNWFPQAHCRSSCANVRIHVCICIFFAIHSLKLLCHETLYLFHKNVFHIATLSFMPLGQSSGYWYKEKWNHNSCLEIN